MTSIQSASLSPYLAILEDEITSDLRSTIKPEDLRAEVRKTLFREVLRQAATALAEMSTQLDWHSKEDDIMKVEAKLGRHLGYIMEMLNLRQSQRINPDHQLTAVAALEEPTK